MRNNFVGFVTFQIKKVTSSTADKFAVICTNESMLKDVLTDAYSIDGITYLRINRCGKLNAQVVRLTYEEYKLKF